MSESTQWDVVVAGGGLAGLSAATVLAEAGKRVLVLERESFLGGRAGAWGDQLSDGTGFQMERGFHAFFRQYYNLRALLRRVDPSLSLLEPQVDYPVLGPEGKQESFKDLPRTPIVNVAELVRRTDTLGLQDILKVPTLKALSMASYGEHTYRRWDHVTAAEYLDSLNFPAEARQMLFEVFSHSFFNPEHRFSAAELLMQFHFYFLGNREGLIFDTMKRPFSTGLFEPLRRYLEARGVEIRTGVEVASVSPRGQGYVVEARALADDRIFRVEGDALVLALSVPGLRSVVARSPTLGDTQFRADVDALGVTWPFAVWRVWIDRRVVGRSPFAGTAGVGILDNVSVYEALEDESRAWSERTGGSVLELHAYGVDPQADEASIKADLLAGLHAVYPETKGATILEERFLHAEDCPSFEPGSWERRPEVTTPWPNLCLAGDFVKLSIPSALMERAVASGYAAANALLRQKRQRIQSVPRRGVLSLLRL